MTEPRKPTVKVSGVVVSYTIVVEQGGRRREWKGDTLDGFARDLAESRKPAPRRARKR